MTTCTQMKPSLSSAITKTTTRSSNFQQELRTSWICACRCISSSSCYRTQGLKHALHHNPLGVEFKTKIPDFLKNYMRNRFGSVLQEVEYDGSHSNCRWKSKTKQLNEKQIAAIADMDRYGLGNKYMGKAALGVTGKYKYRKGEKPWFLFETKPEYSEQHVREHTWRVKYMSPEFLSNYFQKAMSSSTFTQKDQEAFADRQKCSHPDQYRIPQFLLNHPLGPCRQSTFKDG